jgi:hypothetical protein
MTTLSDLVSAIDEIIDDAKYTEPKLIARINDAINVIAGGIRMPDGSTSPPLPDLFTYGTVSTSITLPYASLPADYQRKVFLVYDSTNYKINPPQGGDYHSFALFMKIVSRMDLGEAGSIYAVAVKGDKLYYQGIPAAATTLGIHYYRKPVDITLHENIPDGIPDQFQMRLVKHYVIKEIMGEMLEAGVTEPAVGFKYHEGKFYAAIQDMCDFIAIQDAEPQFYGEDNMGSSW